jgi:hypothetical protein
MPPLVLLLYGGEPSSVEIIINRITGDELKWYSNVHVPGREFEPKNMQFETASNIL